MKKLLYSIIFLTIYGNTWAQGTLSKGLIAYYPFNGTALDLSGNNLNGTIKNAALTTGYDGSANSAYSFNGSSSQINISSFPQFFNNQNFSISLWIRNTGQSIIRNYNSFISYGSSNGTHSFNFAYDNVAPNYSYWDNTNSSYYFTNNASQPKTAWTHITIVQNGNTITNYVNGILSNSRIFNRIIPPVGATNVLNIGAYAPDKQYFKGDIDEVRIYNRALTECEVIQLSEADYNLSTPIFIAPLPSSAVCAGTPSAFNISAVAGATSYEWSVNGVVDATSVSTTFTKTLAASASPYFISVRAIKNCKPSLSSASAITSVNVLAPPANPGTITQKNGAIYACKDATKVYKIPAIPSNVFTEWRINNVVIEGQTGAEGAITLSYIGTNTLSVKTYTSRDGVTCPSVGSSSLSFPVKDVPTNVVISDPGLVCPWYTPLLTATPNDPTFSYTWNINNSKPLASYPTSVKNGINIKFPYDASSPSSQHVVKVAVRNECGTSEATRTVTLKNPVPAVPQIVCFATNSNGLCTQLKATPGNPGNGVAYTAAATYTWKKKNLDNTETLLSATTQVLDLTVPANAGGKSYSVTVTENGCSYYNPFGECPSYLQQGNIPAARSSAEIELATINTYLIYPNPSSGSVTIETKGQVGKAYIFNTFGQVVAEVELTKEETVYNVTLPAKGLYTFKIKAEGETTGYKVVVE